MVNPLNPGEWPYGSGSASQFSLTRGGVMATATATATVNWSKIESDPRFQALHARKSRFLWGLMAFSVIYYFALPAGAAYLPGLFSIKVWGPVNVGLVFALSEFIVAWAIAFIYSKKAAEFDAMADELARDAHRMGA
jgi:uncharacterized membrane protein (DUF485 family)